MPVPLSGYSCSECGWISDSDGSALSSKSSGQQYLVAKGQPLDDEERRRRLRIWSRPAPALELYGPGFWVNDEHHTHMRRSSSGIDLASVRAFRASAAVLQRDESERLLRAFREGGIKVSESAVRRGLMAPADRDVSLSTPAPTLAHAQSAALLPARSGSISGGLPRNYSDSELKPGRVGGTGVMAARQLRGGATGAEADAGRRGSNRPISRGDGAAMAGEAPAPRAVRDGSRGASRDGTARARGASLRGGAGRFDGADTGVGMGPGTANGLFTSTSTRSRAA